MIRIKAPRVWAFRGDGGWHAEPERVIMQDFAARLYTEAMHRRVLALVRACWEDGCGPGEYRHNIETALDALRAQAEKEAGK